MNILSYYFFTNSNSGEKIESRIKNGNSEHMLTNFRLTAKVGTIYTFTIKNYCLPNQVYIKEYTYLMEDVRVKVWEEDNYNYYLKDFYPSILIINNKKYILLEALENKLLKLDDTYINNKSVKEEK